MIEITREKLQEIVNQCNTKADLCRALGLVPAGDNYYRVSDLLEENGIDFSYAKHPWNKNKHYVTRKVPLEEILVNGSYYRNSCHLRTRLLRNKILENKCDICGTSGDEITLELHHKNGNHRDNRIENLQLLCPNCHSKTDNYRGKNIDFSGKDNLLARHTPASDMWISDEESENLTNHRNYKKYISSIHLLEGEEISFEDYMNGVRISKLRKVRHVANNGKNRTDKTPKICPVCGKEFIPNEDTQKYCSVECYRQDTKGNRPMLTQLLNDFKELKSFVQVGNKYNVSDNAVRKWCKLYGIPIHIKELFEYIDNINNINYNYDAKEATSVHEVKRLDLEKCTELYQKGYNIKEVAELLGYSEDGVSNFFKRNHIQIRSGHALKINQYAEDGTFIQSFFGSSEAAKWLVEQGLAKSSFCKRHITSCCNKKENKAYGYLWSYEYPE